MKMFSLTLKFILFFGILCSVQTSYAQIETSSSVAIQKAAAESKYIFLFFYKDKNESTLHLQKVLDQTLIKLKEVKSLSINLNDPSEKPIINRFKLKGTPMPFVIVLAPNGAITGGFSTFTQQQLINSIISPGAASCHKALQERKLVILCLQNEKTANNKSALQAANEFKADPRFAKATEIVMIDPSDIREHAFLKQLDLNLHSSESMTVLIYPPAVVIGKHEGVTTKEQLVSNLKQTTSGCGEGKCCPGGCK